MLQRKVSVATRTLTLDFKLFIDAQIHFSVSLVQRMRNASPCCSEIAATEVLEVLEVL
jgi:hypothetical protein